MPYHWSSPVETAHLRSQSSGQTGLRLHITANNSLSTIGFVRFISFTAVLMALPILALLGNNVLWIVAAPLGATLIAIWMALKTSWHRGTVREELELWVDQTHLRRINPDGSCQVWQANPYWVDVTMQETDGPVLNYLTLRGGGRTVEIGSFLSEQERPKLAQDLREVFLIAVKQN